MKAPDPRLGEIARRSKGCPAHDNCIRSDVAYLLAELRKAQDALDELLYIADNKAADNMIGRWWAGVIKGTIHSHLNPAPKPRAAVADATGGGK